MSIRIVPVLGAIVATAATLAFATPAVAAEIEQRSVAVSFADLDLASPAGMARLDRRLRAAASSVCGSDDDLRDLHSHGQVLDCEKIAMARAHADVQVALHGGGSRMVALVTN